mgnify:CR=1 FL=1|jgi:hypothetical protein
MGNGCSCSKFWIFNKEEEQKKEFNNGEGMSKNYIY